MGHLNKKLLTAAIIGLLFLSLAIAAGQHVQPVLANSGERGEITASSLNVREQPRTNSRIIGSLSRGATVELHERTGSWYKIRVNNRWGYIHGDYVRVQSSASSGSQITGTGKITASRLNVRASASTGARIVGTLNNGQQVDLYERSGQWYKVKLSNGWGYIHGDYVQVTQSSGGNSSGSGSSAGSGSSQVTGSGTITATRLNVRASASTSARIVSSLNQGTKVDLYGKSGQWHQIKVNNGWGYIHQDYVQVSQSGGSSSGSGSSAGSNSEVTGSGTITASRLNVRASASTGSRIIASLNQGTKVDLYERSGQWHKVRVNNQWGYIHSDYVRVSQTSGGSSSGASEQVTGSGTVTASRLNVRESASTSSRIVSFLSSGARVDLYGSSGDWYKIKAGNGWGYVHSSYINTSSQSQGSSSSGTGNINLSGKTIFLDPGHGGRDPGAVVSGVYESNIALGISNKLKSRLEAAGARVVTTRTTDVFLSLGERTARANNSGADIFISIHGNSFVSSAARGVETYYNTQFQGANSKKLAEAVQNRMVNGVNLHNRGVKTSNFEVIRYTRMPSVLLETGFMTNPGDLNILRTQQDKIADELLIAINNYFNN